MLTIRIDASQLQGFTALARSLPDRLNAALQDASTASAGHVLRELKRTVHAISGTLRRAWTIVPARQIASGFQSGVAARLAYAAAEEFGKHAPEQVRAHTRLGRPVRAHVRMSNQPAHPYARPAVSGSIDRIRAIHLAAIRRTLKGGR